MTHPSWVHPARTTKKSELSLGWAFGGYLIAGLRVVLSGRGDVGEREAQFFPFMKAA
jgi:hypothetical protein